MSIGMKLGIGRALMMEAKERHEKELIEEERAYEEKRYMDRLHQERINATLPLVLESWKERKAAASQRKALGGYFQDRLSGEDVPEETLTAFTNLAIQDPEYASSLIETIKKTESSARRRLTGSEIIKMSRLFEQTKPEGMSAEDWVKQAASMVSVDEGGIDFDETLTRLISGEISPEELLKYQVTLSQPAETSLGIIPDFDVTGVIGLDPAKAESLRKLALSEMKTRYQTDLLRAEALVDELSRSGGSDEEIGAASANFEALERLSLEKDQDSAIFNYYAPIVLPELLSRQPELRDYFPQYFDTSTEAPAPEVPVVETPEVPVVETPEVTEWEYRDGQIIPVVK